MGKNSLEGTQNLTYLHKNDERRSKFRCSNYTKEGYCYYSLTKCPGSSHCSRYIERPIKEENKSTVELSKTKKNKSLKFEGIKELDRERIHIMPHFSKRKPNQRKVDKIVEYYQLNECLDKPIYASIKDNGYYLEDGYTRYYVATLLGLDEMPVRIGSVKKSKLEAPFFKKDTWVQHSKLGKGKIVSADTRYIVVCFEKYGEKKFFTSMCLENMYLQLIPEEKKVDVKKESALQIQEINEEKKMTAEAYEEYAQNTFAKKKDSAYHYKEISVLKDSVTEKIYLSIVARDGKPYYEIGRIGNYGDKEYIDLSASATNELYLLLKKNKEENREYDKSVERKVATGKFVDWNDKEIDFVPAKEGKPESQGEKRKIEDSGKRLTEIKARIKSRNAFAEYRGVSTRLMPHQKAACEIAKNFEKFAFFYDTGTGKTVLSLEIMASKYKKEQAKFLVISPKPIIKAAWIADQDEFYPNMKLLPLSKNITLIDYKRINNKWNRIDQESNFHDKMYYQDWEYNRTKAEQFKYIQSVLLGKAEHYIVNGESFVRDYESYKYLGISGLIVDESAVLKNFDSKLCQKVREFAKDLKYVYLLSGKPAPNSSSEYFSQMKIVDPDTFSMSVKAFRSKYYHNINGRLSLISSRKQELFEMIARKSIIVSKTDCLDLPDTSRVVRKFELPDKIMNRYNAMCYELVTTFKEMDKENEKKQNVNKVFVANNKLSAMMKLREITSGFIKNEQGISLTIDDSKQKELFGLVDEIGNNQIIIWCQFKYEIERLAEELIKSGKKVVTAFSGTIDLDRSIALFKEGRADILIAHPKTLQYGVTLVNCCFAIYYSMSYSFEQYEQSYARIYRNGQKNYCSYYFLQAENTIDEEIFECVMKKKHDVEICEHILKAISEHATKYTGRR